MSAHSINAGKLVFLGFAALQQIGSIIFSKSSNFGRKTYAESVYAKPREEILAWLK